MNEVTLEEKLRGELPCYMLPKPIKVPVIPLLVNGKIDRQSLLKRYEDSRKSTFDFSDQDLQGFLSPEDFEKGRLLLNAVAQVLVTSEKPLLSDNFFDIGGDSLNMVQVRMCLFVLAIQCLTANFENQTENSFRICIHYK